MLEVSGELKFNAFNQFKRQIESLIDNEIKICIAT